jgi:hypothetical protein
MKETPRRRITVTSSLNEISTNHGWIEGDEGGIAPSVPTPFYSRLLDRYLKDDVNGFPSTSYICFMSTYEALWFIE